MQIAMGRGRGLREGPRRRVAWSLIEDALWGVQGGMSSGRILEGGDPGRRVPRGRRGIHLCHSPTDLRFIRISVAPPRTLLLLDLARATSFSSTPAMRPVI